MRIRRPSPPLLVSLVALFVALGGAGYAATGGNFVLGQPNTATAKTSLSANVVNPTLQLSNTRAAAGATALGLTVASGHPPLTVSSATKVKNLNADKLDSIDSRGFVQTFPGYPTDLAGTAKTFFDTNDVGVGSVGGLLILPGLAHVDASCPDVGGGTGEGTLIFTADTSGRLLYDDTEASRLQGSLPLDSGQQEAFPTESGVARITLHWFVGAAGSENGQTLATMTFFEGSGYSGYPCVFTASGMLQTNAG